MDQSLIKVVYPKNPQESQMWDGSQWQKTGVKEVIDDPVDTAMTGDDGDDGGGSETLDA